MTTIPNAHQAKSVSPDTISIPQDAVVFNVLFHCMNPVFREGQKVIAIPHASHDIPSGTLVIVATRKEGVLCKVWRERRGDAVTLGFFNGQGTGTPGVMTVPIADVERVWIILGVWFDGVMPNAKKTIVPKERTGAILPPATTTETPVLKIGNPGMEKYADAWGTSWDNEIRRHRDRLIAMRKMYAEVMEEKRELDDEILSFAKRAGREGWTISTNTVLFGRDWRKRHAAAATADS